MAGWHHQLDGHEFERTPGVGDGQGGLACCGSWGRKESDTTEQLNWTELSLCLLLFLLCWLFPQLHSLLHPLIWSLCLQFSSTTQSCPTLWNSMDCSTSGLPVHHQVPEFTQTHAHWVNDAIQPSHPLILSSLYSTQTALAKDTKGLLSKSIGQLPIFLLDILANWPFLPSSNILFLWPLWGCLSSFHWHFIPLSQT